jgi:hypothetical protein
MATQAMQRSGKQLQFRLIALLLGLLLGLVLATLALRHYRAKQAPHFFGNYVIEGFQPHPHLGYAPKPSSTINSCKIIEPDTIYCAQYIVDKSGRRQMPMSDSATAHLMFFGCSYTYGEGVNNTETFTHLLAHTLPNYQVYNYAYSGYGPQQTLAKLEFGHIASEVSQQRGYCVYMLLPEHISRAAGAPYYIQGWGTSSPHYAMQADSLVYFPNHKAWRPTYVAFQRFLGWCGLGSFVYPPPKTYTHQEVDLTVAILKEAQARYLALYPEGHFVVALPPAISNEENFIQIANALTMQGVSIWDFHSAFHLNSPWAIYGDGHLSTKGHQEVAKLLSSYIQ